MSQIVNTGGKMIAMSSSLSVSSAKMDEPIKVLFGCGLVSPRRPCLPGSLSREWALFDCNT